MLYFPVYNPRLDQRIIINNVTFVWNGCWLWNKGTCSEGYGRFRYNGVIYRAHRYSYLCFIGDIPPGYVVRHMCHNPACCNPMHLKIGTDYDNWHDSEETHQLRALNTRKKYIINGIEHLGCVDTSRKLGISPMTLVKYTDPTSRIFDLKSYRNNCIKANVSPAV